MALVSSEVSRDDTIRSGPVPCSVGRGEYTSAFSPFAEQQNCHAVPHLALISPREQRVRGVLPPSSGSYGATAESGARFRCNGLENSTESSASRRGEKESATLAAENPKSAPTTAPYVSASEATPRAAEIEADTLAIAPAETTTVETRNPSNSAPRHEGLTDVRRENLGGAHESASGDHGGGSETISERERLFLQQLHRSALESRQRILTNAADVWMSHQESEMWLGQLEALASAQQKNDKPIAVTSGAGSGQQQHATWRTGGLYRFGSGTFRKAHAVAEKPEPQAHQPRGERRLKRSGESSKSTQCESIPQQRLQQPQPQQTPSLAVEEPRGSTPAAPAARRFSRAKSVSGGTSTSGNDTGGGSGVIFGFPLSGGFSRSSTGFSGGGGGTIVVPRSPLRASWLFGSTTRSAQERGTSRLSSDGST